MLTPDSSQLLNGACILVAFCVGYIYASNVQTNQTESTDKEKRMQTNIFKNSKMILVVRNDLKMGKGKIAAQCCHAAVGAYQKASKRTPSIVSAWENSGSAKIAVKVETSKELMEIKRSAEQANLITCLIRDAGRTQIAPNSVTVLAIGPAYADILDRITGHLKLL